MHLEVLILYHKVDGMKSTGGVGESGDGILTKEAINGDLGRMEPKWFLYESE